MDVADPLAEQNERQRDRNGFHTMVYLASALIILGAAAIIFCMCKYPGAGHVTFVMSLIGLLILLSLYLEDQYYVSQFHQTFCLWVTILYLVSIVIFLSCVPGTELVEIASFILCTCAVLIPLILYFFGVFATGPDPLSQRVPQRPPRQRRKSKSITSPGHMTLRPRARKDPGTDRMH